MTEQEKIDHETEIAGIEKRLKAMEVPTSDPLGFIVGKLSLAAALEKHVNVEGLRAIDRNLFNECVVRKRMEMPPESVMESLGAAIAALEEFTEWAKDTEDALYARLEWLEDQVNFPDGQVKK